LSEARMQILQIEISRRLSAVLRSVRIHSHEV
jgi:hypothetical protein